MARPEFPFGKDTKKNFENYNSDIKARVESLQKADEAAWGGGSCYGSEGEQDIKIRLGRGGEGQGRFSFADMRCCIVFDVGSFSSLISNFILFSLGRDLVFAIQYILDVLFLEGREI